MPNFLVVGGNGVIGHFVTRQLVHAGHQPVVMSRSGDTLLVNDIMDRCHFANGDVADLAFVEATLAQYDITHIVHLGAALGSVTEKTPPKGVRGNIEGTANILEAAKNHGAKRVLIASSKAVYAPIAGEFAQPTYRPVPETGALAPATVYGITKYACEMLAAWYRRQHGLEVAALRFGSTIGPGKITRHGGAQSRYSVIVENALAGRPVDIAQGGDAVCDAIFNGEVARGILTVLDAPTLAHCVYNIATGTGFTLKDLAAAVQRRFPDAQISIGPGYHTGSMNCILDVSRAREEFGFVADHDIDRIVGDYLAMMELLGLEPPPASH